MELPDLNALEDIVVTIEEEDGTEIECQVICMFEYEEKAYAALTPTDEDSEDAYIFGVSFEEQGDEVEFTLENIDDDELLEELSQVLMQIMEEADDDEGADGSVELPDGVIVEPAGGNAESHERVVTGGDDDSYWDQFINKKLEDI
ncbi:MAG: DUF1292 domain-containing protein [Eubacterium sp.]|nr:DUF1292 domain-containing protein [Eubacterium sp.]